MLSCCCRRWVKTTRTAFSSATSCTAVMATVQGPCGHMCGSMAVRSAVQCGTRRGLMPSSGTRLSWLSAPSGLMNTRYKLCHYHFWDLHVMMCLFKSASFIWRIVLWLWQFYDVLMKPDVPLILRTWTVKQGFIFMMELCRPIDRHLQLHSKALVITTHFSLEVNLVLITHICNLISIDSLVNAANVSAQGP